MARWLVLLCIGDWTPRCSQHCLVASVDTITNFILCNIYYSLFILFLIILPYLPIPVMEKKLIYWEAQWKRAPIAYIKSANSSGGTRFADWGKWGHTFKLLPNNYTLLEVPGYLAIGHFAPIYFLYDMVSRRSLSYIKNIAYTLLMHFTKNRKCTQLLNKSNKLESEISVTQIAYPYIES